MSEDKGDTPIKSMDGYDVKNLKAFFDHVGANNPCEACGSKKWVNKTGRSMIHAGFIDNSGFGLHFLPVFCINCGNTRIFNRARIDHFIENELQELSDGTEES